MSKSSGMLMLGTRILKECMIQAFAQLTRLFNQCIEKGIFPQKWKVAMVTPIPKGSKKPTVENIRPISLLPCPGKILENIIHKRLYTYLESNELLCREQSGFRRNHGTHNPIIDLTDYINKQFNDGGFVVCIFVDLAKAFNSLDCQVLVEKLSRLGIRENVLKLLADYLGDRKQFVNLNGSISSLRRVKYGVPQGSVLGPLLFSAYMNDLPEFFNYLRVKMYADDTVFYCGVSRKNLAGQVERINCELKMFSEWCRKNKGTLNVEKTKCVLFTPNLKKLKRELGDSYIDLTMGGKKLNFVDSYCYLGLELDQCLTMSSHLRKVVNKVRPLLYKLGKLCYYIDNTTAVRIYKTYILPVIEHGLYALDCMYTN